MLKMVDAKLNHSMSRLLTEEEKGAVGNFVYRLGSENAFSDGIAVSEDEAIKFLMARKFDVGRAISLYHTHCMLRGRFELEHLEPNTEPLYSELQSGKFTVSSGKGVEGDTLCIFYARRHFPNRVDHVTVLQSIVFQLDSVMKRPAAQRSGLSLIYDMTSSGYVNFDFELAMKVLHLLKGGYPARLKHVYILAAPFWFRASMTILSSFLRDKIKDRVEVVKTYQDLYRSVPQECLPKELGGSIEHNHKDWLEECMRHFHVSVSMLSLDRAVVEDKDSSSSTTLVNDDSRNIFENVENHEPQNRTEKEIPPTIKEPTSIPESPPPPLPPRPAHRSSRPIQEEDKAPTRALPPEPAVVPVIYERSDSENSQSDKSSQGRQPLSLENFLTHMTRIGKKGVHKEYEELRSLPPSGTFESTLYPVNTRKNRYNNILAFEETRVKLQRINDDPFSDYINGNYVDGFDSPRKFISTQGPTPYTFNDFWRMVWEQKVGIIVMVTRCVERNRIKCGEYWPQQSSDSVKYGNIIVENVGQNVSKHFTIIRFDVTNAQRNITRTLFHIQFTSWPDFGVLPTASPILDIIAFIDEQQKELAEQLKLEQPASNGSSTKQELEGSGEYETPNSVFEPNNLYPPVIIHCSAGVGRTGTFTCISNSVERLQKTGLIDIYSTVKKIREQRAFSIQTPEQYQFCYTGILEHVIRERDGDTSDIENSLMAFLRRESSSDSE